MRQLNFVPELLADGRPHLGGAGCLAALLSRATASNRRKLAAVFGSEGGDMYARVATFESDPANVDDAINLVRSEVESGDTPAELEGAKMLMLVNPGVAEPPRAIEFVRNVFLTAAVGSGPSA